jgi:fructose-1,6-bisphosphatase/inositol monophosphatase family enzyme
VASREAGALRTRHSESPQRSLKGRHDIVTAMDREVERFIRNSIARRYPAGPNGTT